MNCSHNDTKTPYCPSCGKRVSRHDLTSLLEHIRHQVCVVMKTIDRIGARPTTDNPEFTLRRSRYLASKNKTLEKWDSWEKLLMKVLSDEVKP